MSQVARDILGSTIIILRILRDAQCILQFFQKIKQCADDWLEYIRLGIDQSVNHLTYNIIVILEILQ